LLIAKYTTNIQEVTMTILEQARAGEITAEMIYVAEKEGITPEIIRQGVASGEIVILKSSRKNINPVAVGKDLFTKVSASVGMYELDDTIEG
jgi:phosphomethylpyrimidine synthase